MAGLIWRFVEARLRRSVPPESLSSVLGDLAEDYDRRRASRGRVRADVWLLQEGRSLTRAYVFAGWRRRRLWLFDDLRRAWRRIVAQPGVSMVCAALLAVAIGLSTAMFSVVDSLLLRPAPFHDADRLIRQGVSNRAEPTLMSGWYATGLLQDVQAGRATSFRFGEDNAVIWPGAFVTPGMFDMLGVRPLRGRGFAISDGRAAASDEVILSETIWRTVFAGDPTFLGRRIQLNGVAGVVVGIMPAAFRFPAPNSVVWKPLVPGQNQVGIYTLFARLKPEVTVSTAKRELQDVVMRHAQYPNSREGPPIEALAKPALGVLTLHALWLLLGGVGLVFVVACANVNSLLLAGLSARRLQFSLCTALGATRARLLRQATVEHALIGLAGVVAGLVLAWTLTSITPSFFLGRTLNQIDIDTRSLLVASCLGVASVLLAGLIPAWLGTRADALGVLRGSRQGDTESPSSRLATRSLLVVEIALACSLLVGSALLLRSFSLMAHADRGINSDGIVRVEFGSIDTAFPTLEARALGVNAMQDLFASWPGIQTFALTRELPPYPGFRVLIQSWRSGDVSEGVTVQADRYRVSPDYFRLYEIPVVRGRVFGPDDPDTDIVIGRRLAESLWPGEDPIGQRFALGGLEAGGEGGHPARPDGPFRVNAANLRRVIGVTGEVHLPTLERVMDRPEIYVPLGKESRTLYLSFRCVAPCPNEQAIQAGVRRVHPAIRTRITSSAEDVFAAQLTLPRAVADVGGVFAIVAVVTAAGGLFSVLTYAVGRRRREFGIRAALGASPGQVRRLVVRECVSIVVIGIAAGTVGGMLVAKSLGALLYGVTGADPTTWVAVVGTIAVATFAAAWRPALQAMRVNPVKLLREE
jgi:putative ABC transport system permease protein